MTYSVQHDETVRMATSEETAVIDNIRAETSAQIASLENIVAAKISAQKKLLALGLSEEEIGALLGR